MPTPRQPKIEPSRELTLLEQAARELNERLRAVKKREGQRRQLAAYLKRRPMLTRKDLLDVAATMARKRGDAPVASGNVARVGDAIAKAREAKGLSRAQLGKQISRHQTSVKYWEEGQGFPSPEVRAKLGKVLGINLQALMNGDARAPS